MRGKKLYNRKDIGEYFRDNEFISAYELRLKCKLKDSTVHNIIKMCLKRGWVKFHTYFKLPTQTNKVKIYQVLDKESIMRTWVDLAIEEWTKLKQEKLLTSEVASPKASPNTTTKTNPNSYSVLSASLVPIKNNKAVPSGEFGPVILEKLPEDSGAVLGGETELRDTIELKRRQREASEELAPINWKGLNGRTLSPEEFEKVFQLAKTFRK